MGKMVGVGMNDLGNKRIKCFISDVLSPRWLSDVLEALGLRKSQSLRYKSGAFCKYMEYCIFIALWLEIQLSTFFPKSTQISFLITEFSYHLGRRLLPSSLQL